MRHALIGYSGFVGSTLRKQAHFDALYRANNIHEIAHQAFDTVVCAGAPAQKWLANLEPEKDWRAIETLISHLKTIQCKRFILISTVDVFKAPQGVNEDSIVDLNGLHAYGAHRRELETFVAQTFPAHLIVRLPGLVGPGLRKNVIFDFLNNNNLSQIDSRAKFQFYPMVNLWPDIQIAQTAGLSLVHLTAEPIAVADIALHGFGQAFDHERAGSAANYNLQTKHQQLYASTQPYQYSAKETLLAIRAYAQSEPRTLPQEPTP